MPTGPASFGRKRQLLLCMAVLQRAITIAVLLAILTRDTVALAMLERDATTPRTNVTTGSVEREILHPRAVNFIDVSAPPHLRAPSLPVHQHAHHLPGVPAESLRKPCILARAALPLIFKREDPPHSSLRTTPSSLPPPRRPHYVAAPRRPWILGHPDRDVSAGLIFALSESCRRGNVSLGVTCTARTSLDRDANVPGDEGEAGERGTTPYHDGVAQLGSSTATALLYAMTTRRYLLARDCNLDQSAPDSNPAALPSRDATPPLPQIQGRSFRRRGFTVLLRVSPPSSPSTSLSRTLIRPASSLPHTSDAPPKPHRPHLILAARAGNVEDARGAMR
ncbi:hypothetical protein C8J57DRAFT_1505280 [Mycena rebaudengoi]|nr:hypothetical protein C8J57DRAFT_1505280 [Mycena rebaudengoi]